jgi:uncharacterized protein YdeI (YjbR/CyaY-like superfamily)
MPPHTSFRSGTGFRRWLAKRHGTAAELHVRLFKVHAQHLGMTYRDALDEALCHGWIDGVRHGLDADSFLIRFTPRKAKSYWSDVNARRMKELIAKGRVHAAGLAAFGSHDERRAPRYAFEAAPASFDAAGLQLFRANRRAWANYQKQAPWYQRLTTHWVMRAKRPETRARRLAALIECSANGTRIPQLNRSKKK